MDQQDQDIARLVFAWISRMVDGTYYQPASNIYFLPYLLKLEENLTVLAHSRLADSIFEIKEDSALTRDTKLSCAIRRRRGSEHYTYEEIIQFIDDILVSQAPDTLLDRLMSMSLVNEACKYKVGIESSNTPSQHFFYYLFEYCVNHNITITSNPRLNWSNYQKITYVNLDSTSVKIQYPSMMAGTRIEIQRKCSFIGGLYEPDKAELSKYFGPQGVTPRYVSLNLSGLHPANILIGICHQIVSVINGSTQAACVLKYYDGRWGMGTTFVIVPPRGKWIQILSNQITSTARKIREIYQIFDFYK